MSKTIKTVLLGILQIVLVACLLYALTGGAFLVDWEQIRRWKSILRLTTFGAFLVVGITGMVLYRKDPKYFNEIEPFSSIDAFFRLPPAVSVGCVTLAFFVTQFTYQLAKHYGLETHLWDMGFFDQVLWNTAHGDFLVTSVRGGLHVFAEHFKPILALIAQIYRVKSEIWLLFLANDLVIASSLAAVYLITKEIGRSHLTALALTIAVFFYQPWINGVNFLYHTQMLIDPFLLWGFYCFLRKQHAGGLVFFILALMSKESAIPDLVGLGSFLIFRGRKKWGVVVLIMTLAWLATFLFVIEPRFVFTGHFKEKWTLYREWLHPTLQTFKTMMTPNPLGYLLSILGPFLFLSLACRGWWLLLGPSWAFRMMSMEPAFRGIDCQYMGGFEALIFVSAAYGLAHWVQTDAQIGNQKKIFLGKVPAILRDPKAVCFLLVLVAVLFAGKSQLVTTARYVKKVDHPENQRVIRLIESIPVKYSVLASQNLAAHVSHRSHMYVFCSMFPKTPYEELAKHPDLIVFDKRPDNPCDRGVLQSCVDRSHRLVFEMDYLQIYANPVALKGDMPFLNAQWQALAERPLGPWKVGVLLWYRLGLCAIVIFFFVRILRRISMPKAELL